MPNDADEPSVWLITGCSSGLGRALAEHALERGVRVAVTARDRASVADLAAGYGDRALPLRLESMRQSPTRPDDYEQTAGKRRAATLGVSGRQPRDPVRAAAAIAAAVDAGAPPLRLLLGSDALGGTRARLERLRDEIATDEEVTESVDRYWTSQSPLVATRSARPSADQPPTQ
jgi:NAD(P)-dependent dehydrogenase (short-subunit alcohol dehydrogenase family)